MSKIITLKDVCDYVGCKLPEQVNAHLKITGVKPLDVATASDISFLSNEKYHHQLSCCDAAAVFLTHTFADQCRTTALVTPNPYLAIAKAAELFDTAPVYEASIHPSAVIESSAKVGECVSIGPNAYVGEGVVLGDHVVVGPGCIIEAHSQIGAHTYLKANVSIGHHVIIGNDCIIHHGAVIGCDGFGNANHQGRWIKVPQLGSVIIEDDVEVGSNTTVDRGSFGDTKIGCGVRIDNLVQIAHNVEIGAFTAIAAMTGIAGSTTIGKYCMIGGAVGISGHIAICDQVIITAKSGVAHNIHEPGMYSSTLTAKKVSVWRRTIARLHQLDKMAARLKQLEKRIKKDLE